LIELLLANLSLFNQIGTDYSDSLLFLPSLYVSGKWVYVVDQYGLTCFFLSNARAQLASDLLFSCVCFGLLLVTGLIHSIVLGFDLINLCTLTNNHCLMFYHVFQSQFLVADTLVFLRSCEYVLFALL